MENEEKSNKRERRMNKVKNSKVNITMYREVTTMWFCSADISGTNFDRLHSGRIEIISSLNSRIDGKL